MEKTTRIRTLLLLTGTLIGLLTSNAVLTSTTTTTVTTTIIDAWAQGKSGSDANTAGFTQGYVKQNSGGGSDANTAGFTQGQTTIHSGGGDDTNEIQGPTSGGKVNCGGGADTVILAFGADLQISKNCETVLTQP
jgi:hypothetical protein